MFSILPVHISASVPSTAMRFPTLRSVITSSSGCRPHGMRTFAASRASTVRVALFEASRAVRAASFAAVTEALPVARIWLTVASIESSSFLAWEASKSLAIILIVSTLATTLGAPCLWMFNIPPSLVGRNCFRLCVMHFSMGFVCPWAFHVCIRRNWTSQLSSAFHKSATAGHSTVRCRVREAMSTRCEQREQVVTFSSPSGRCPATWLRKAIRKSSLSVEGRVHTALMSF